MWTLASGAALAAVGSWSLGRPAIQQALLRLADRKVQEETGLALRADGLEFSPFRGRLVVRGLSLGDDLLRVGRAEVHADLLSLLGDSPRLHSLDLDGLALKLDHARLGRLRLKPRDPAAPRTRIRLGDLRIRGASLEVREPSWGIAEGLAVFDADGRGLGPNALELDLRSRALSLRARGEARAQPGSLSLHARLDEERLAVDGGEARLGAQSLSFQGAYAPPSRQFDATATGSLHLPGLPVPGAGLQGDATFRAGASGTLPSPRWTLRADGRGLAADRLPLRPGTLHLEAGGAAGQVRIEALRWDSEDGRLEGELAWRPGKRTTATLRGTGLDLGGLAARLRAPELRGLRADGTADLELPGDPWVRPRLDALKAKVAARFTHGAAEAGGLEASLDAGRLDLGPLRVRIPDLEVEARASGKAGPRALSALDATGTVRTEAAKVARSLEAWGIVALDMGGRVEGSATLAWNPAEGLRLDGAGQVQAPRWHQATAERLEATVRIRGDELFVFDIRVDKGEGRGVGDLWLTWADLPEGSTQMDMCFRAFRLPAAEGLKAAELGDLPITGIVSGWTRLGGPFHQLLLTGDMRAEEAEVYGLRLPAAAANLELDLTGDRLRIPEFRIAESQDQLYGPEPGQGGLLALRGGLDMDLARGTWTGHLAGRVDSERLGLGWPRILGRVEGSLEGPWTAPFGPLELPTGRLQVGGLRVFLGQQSLEGLEASIRLDRGEFSGRIGVEGREVPLLAANAWDTGGQAVGGFRLLLAPESAGTSSLARRLTDDILEDLALDLTGSGAWGSGGLRWEARSERLEARFSAFSLAQLRPGTLNGDGARAVLDLQVEALDATATAGRAGTVALSGTLPFSLTAPVAIRATGRSEISEVKEVMDRLLDLDPYSLLADMRPEGLAVLDLTLGGAFDSPRLDGFLNLERGRLHVKSYPQGIEDLSFSLRFEDREIQLLREAPLRGRFAQGDFLAWGSATWVPGDAYVPGGLSSYSLQASLKDFQIRDLPEGFELQGDLEATLRGDDENGGILRGILKADRTLYRADINLADLILSNTLGATPDLSALDPDDLLSRIELDLDLQLEQPWQFDTNLLKLQGRAEGPFRVRGTLARPGLKGKMALVPGGRLTNLLPAGDIVLEQGTIDFVDPNTLDPVLNLQGRVDVPPYLVNLSLTGNLNQLSVSPTSTPSLRQDEIVSLLIDPATAQTVGTGSGTSQSSLNSGLASASYGLISTLAFARFQENLRKTLGLDRVSFAIRTGSTGTLESNLILGKTFTILDRRIPLLYGYRQAGEAVTHSGQAEWRLGNLVMQFGLSRTGTDPINPTGQIRYTWSPRW